MSNNSQYINNFELLSQHNIPNARNSPGEILTTVAIIVSN